MYDCQALIAVARRHKVPVLVDPKGNDFSRYRGADILTPNLQELEKIVGPCSTEQILVSKSTALMEELNIGALLITRGEQGMSKAPIFSSSIKADRKSTRLNSSHVAISYAVFCLKK